MIPALSHSSPHQLLHSSQLRPQIYGAEKRISAVLCQNSLPPDSMSIIKWWLFYTTKTEVVCYATVVTGTFNMNHKGTRRDGNSQQKRNILFGECAWKDIVARKLVKRLLYKQIASPVFYLFGTSECCHLPPNPLLLFCCQVSEAVLDTSQNRLQEYFPD